MLLTGIATMPAAVNVRAQEMKKEAIRIWSDVDGNDLKVTLTPYLPEHNRLGAAVIVCPGGSYFWLDNKSEGDAVGRWLASNGIAAFVLKYRTGSIGGFIHHWRAPFGGAQHPAMIQDLQRSIAIVRENAPAWNINPSRIGAMGFSAGGHLVMLSAIFSETDFTAARGTKTAVSLAPDFVVPVYPVVTLTHPKYTHKRSRRGLLGEKGMRDMAMRDSLSLENHVSAALPPVFLINCVDDPIVKYQNSEILADALEKAGARYRYIQYKTGGHGFGATDHKGTPECRQWRSEFLAWLDELFK